MSLKQIHICDGCDKVIDNVKDIYYLDLKTDEFWDGTETDFLEKHLEFCGECAIDIKNTLKKIEEKLNNKDIVKEVNYE